MIEGFTCQRKVKPIHVWVEEEDPNPEICHPCFMGTLASYYMGVLKKANAEKQVKAFEAAYESRDVLIIAKAMDKIKDEVGESIKKDLLELDCFVQSYGEMKE